MRDHHGNEIPPARHTRKELADMVRQQGGLAYLSGQRRRATHGVDLGMADEYATIANDLQNQVSYGS